MIYIVLAISIVGIISTVAILLERRNGISGCLFVDGDGPNPQIWMSLSVDLDTLKKSKSIVLDVQKINSRK